jgi:two-component system KDP operon response regulator KdpE
MVRGQPRILVINVEPEVRRLLRASFFRHDYEYMEANDATTAIATLATSRPDAILLDLRLPERAGFAVIRHIRKTVPVPIVILCARDDVISKVKALESGADAYVTKPFNVDELLARLRVALRHGLQAAGETPVFRTGPLTVDLIRKKIFLRGEEVHLSPKEFSIIRLLANNAGRVVTYQELLKVLWEAGSTTNVQYLRTLMWQMRQKLEPQSSIPQLLKTEAGVGYRLLVLPAE